MKAKQLSIEPLEDRQLLSTSPISPTVHHEQIAINHPGPLVYMVGATMPALEDTKFPIGTPIPANTSYSHHASGESGNAELYPVSLKGVTGRVILDGGTIVGKMNPMAPWHVFKNYADGAGVRFEGSGEVEAKFQHITNVEDGYDPRATFHIHDAYLDHIHDDMVENDSLFSGDISNSYMRGHTFLSARPSSGSPTTNTKAVTKIDNVLVELELQAWAGGESKTDQNKAGGYPYADGLGTGSLFKFIWGSTASGRVEVKNSMFLVPRNGESSNKSMQFPPGTYENVTVAWLGKGAYPAAIPKGVTVVTDRKVFDKAVDAFFASHPMFHKEPALTSPDMNASLQALISGLAFDQTKKK